MLAVASVLADPLRATPCEPRERSGSSFRPRRSDDGVAVELLGDLSASVAAASP
jgi:hypothetical protein